jgi:hypothetical protein
MDPITFESIGPLGGGSDYAPFLNHLGIASVDFGYKFQGSYPVYVCFNHCNAYTIINDFGRSLCSFCLFCFVSFFVSLFPPIASILSIHPLSTIVPSRIVLFHSLSLFFCCVYTRHSVNYPLTSFRSLSSISSIHSLSSLAHSLPLCSTRCSTRDDRYHSVYDSFHWMKTFGDPTFEYHVRVARLWGLLAMRYTCPWRWC